LAETVFKKKGLQKGFARRLNFEFLGNFVGLSNILDSIGMEEFRRREPVKRAHRYIVGAILVCS
jgi:hypothetical protein